MPDTPEDEFTELVDADIPRVDLVDKAANGTRFLIAKAATGMVSPDVIRDLIGKGADEPDPDAPETFSAAQAMALVHAASLRKAGDVAKAVEPDLDPTAILAEPDSDAPGDPTQPGSPAWEAVDAASARKWTALLVRARNALRALAERETIEGAAVDGEDFYAAADLYDGAASIDCAISVLARYAVDEQAEADLAAEGLAAVGKAMGDFDTSTLETLEALTPVVKAGRVLSAGNEAAIRDAVAALQRVLALLPQIPTEDDGQPVAKMKETTMTVATDSPAEPETAEVAEVAKADAAQVLVHTADGRPFATVASDALMPIVQPEAPEGSEGPVEEAAAEPMIEDGEDAAVIPGTETVVSPAPEDDDVMKSANQAGFARLLAEALSPIAEELRRSAGLADVVKGLEEKVEHLRLLPDDRKSPLFNGASGTPGGAQAPDELEPLRKAVADAQTPSAKQDAQQQLAWKAIKATFTRAQ